MASSGCTYLDLIFHKAAGSYTNWVTVMVTVVTCSILGLMQLIYVRRSL